MAIRQIKNGKAAGPDNIPAEALKSEIERSCTDQIATLWIIVEQSVEWNSSLYINFIDYEKAFDSVDRRTLWKRLRHCGVPEKIVSIIRNSYDGLQC
ncbi:unnamed protein product [Schistosoma margrebowiei]|uniref:Uncharacterized protein n=1 Tax=Schistosoma margrebowiei TaxID=48269 RepID=A0A183M2C3_9TREM|nr:unnamed protein product [Schistosoma margrebowiei]